MEFLTVSATAFSLSFLYPQKSTRLELTRETNQITLKRCQRSFRIYPAKNDITPKWLNQNKLAISTSLSAPMLGCQKSLIKICNQALHVILKQLWLQHELSCPKSCLFVGCFRNYVTTRTGTQLSLIFSQNPLKLILRPSIILRTYFLDLPLHSKTNCDYRLACWSENISIIFAVTRLIAIQIHDVQIRCSHARRL